MKKAALIFVLTCFIFTVRLPAQSMESSQFNMTGFPQWARDLRRAEIIAFGSFPFAHFFAKFIQGSIRFANHGWNMRYAPFPFNSAGSIEPTQSEKFFTLGLAAGGAVMFAVIDYVIVRNKRNRLEKENKSLPEGTPIITRMPLYEEETQGSDNQESNRTVEP